MQEGYFVEHNGDCWQSVFPQAEANKSQLHGDVADAFAYMTLECGVDINHISVIDEIGTTPASQYNA